MMTSLSLYGRGAFISDLEKQVKSLHPDSTLTVHKLCKITGMSRTDLHRKIKQYTGLSASAYLRHFRVRQAKSLLMQNPGWSVQEVGFAVGFSSPSYFSRVFKAVEGASPESFRKRSENLEHM